jgi:hypothetical protein
MLVGTFGSEIYEFTASSEKIESDCTWTIDCRMRGHFTPNPLWTNEVWGLCVCNTEKNANKYISCSDDATLRLYDTK